MKEIRTSQSRYYVIRRAIDGYRPGDIFEPSGEKNDRLIIEHYCNIVYNEDEPAEKKPAKSKTGRRK
jgi:hypothetical protein